MFRPDCRLTLTGNKVQKLQFNPPPKISSSSGHVVFQRGPCEPRENQSQAPLMPWRQENILQPRVGFLGSTVGRGVHPGLWQEAQVGRAGLPCVSWLRMRATRQGWGGQPGDTPAHHLTCSSALAPAKVLDGSVTWRAECQWTWLGGHILTATIDSTGGWAYVCPQEETRGWSQPCTPGPLVR